MMPILKRRKARDMEKVENLYCTARAQNNYINTTEQLESRLRDAGCAHRMARAIKRRAPQDERVERQFDE